MPRQPDELAGQYGQTRAGLIGIGIARVLRDGLRRRASRVTLETASPASYV